LRRVKLVLRDRKQAQRGSVLSGVLIIVAFLAIIGGAVMTELTTSFLISRNLVNRVGTQATVNSAMELALDKLQNTQLASGCPTLGPVAMNNRSTIVAYTTCAPVVDRRSPQFRQIASLSSQFSINGTHAKLPGLDDYIVGTVDGTVFDYAYGSSNPRWTLTLGPGGAVTGTPLVMPDPQNGGQFLDVIPASGPQCSPETYCLSVWSDDLSSNPSQQCSMAAIGGAVITQPAASPTSQGIVFYADGSRLEATDASQGGNQCDPEATTIIGGGQPVVAGPVAFRCSSGCGGGNDRVYAVVSDSASSRLVEYRYHNGNLTFISSLTLPYANAVGLATSGSALPATAAITFAGGGLDLVRLAANGGMSPAGMASIPAAITAAPYWCTQCGSVIGVGGRDGGLYLFDSAAIPYATYPAGGAPISTSPAADPAGDWFFGADDGFLYEVQVQTGQPLMTLARTYGAGAMGRIGSSVQVDACSTGICAYLGSLAGRAYLVPLDARYVVMTACLTTASPACSGANPRLWAQVEVGVAGSPQTVHVQGWSYYSP
jgi:hypothetical protein